MELNAAKCGLLTTDLEPARLWIGTESIPVVQRYMYLGFPVTLAVLEGDRTIGIDWQEHLRCRMATALARARFLTTFSGSWGPAHRLRVYQQYLAPIFEYGAPLTYAALFLQDGIQTAKAKAIMSDWKELLFWIAGGTGRWQVTANLLGLLTLSERFTLLHTAFQWQLDSARPDLPLFRLLARGCPFLRSLRKASLYTEWKVSRRPQDQTKPALLYYLDGQRRGYLERASQKAYLTRIIPFSTR